MKKILLIFVLSMLAVGVSFSVLVQGGQSLTVGGPAIHQQEDWEKKYYELKAEYDKLVNIIVPQVEALGSRLDEMKSEIDKMRSELETSRAEYRVLDIKYKTAVRDLSTRTTLMYAFLVTTVVFLATTLYLALRRPKART
ncbi:MAG: hypothetical protein ACE5OW_08125 [Candidatus Bathyarchaeia archaeon]